VVVQAASQYVLPCVLRVVAPEVLREVPLEVPQEAGEG